MRILILGGTEEARLLAAAVVERGHHVTLSYAGRTTDPVPHQGEVRVGGFGGADGLSDYIVAEGIERLVDATHPYSTQIAANAVEAAQRSDVKLIRLIRPAWPEPQDGSWRHVPNVEEAAANLPRGARALLTVGHRGLDHFLARTDCSFVVRSIEPPEQKLPVHARSLLQRPPFYVGAETELMRYEGVSHLVTKNSGGAQTEAKLRAAQQLRLTVMMIARPVLPDAREVPTVGQALAALRLDG
jgi:precorrin-6A/cobalt-precorrin-6A reductase